MSTRENKMTAPLRDTHANWTTLNPVVPEGVLAITTGRLYTGSVEYFIGDGTSTYTQLAKFGEAHDSDGKIPIADILTNAANGLLKLDTDGKALADNLRITGAIADGAIIESGSNANGNYTKFADGTMICHANIQTTGYQTSIAFPAAFIVMPKIVFQSYFLYDNNTGGSTYEYLIGNCTNTTLIFYWLLNRVLQGQIGNAGYIAIGRWKA